MSASRWFFDVPEAKRWDDDRAWAEKHFGAEMLDPGIIRVVRILNESGIETCQSCEGPDGLMPEGRHGTGHAYTEATVDVTYQPWAVLDVCNQYGIRVDQISECFRVEDGRPVGHVWSVELHSPTLAKLRDGWYGESVLAELGVQDAS